MCPPGRGKRASQGWKGLGGDADFRAAAYNLPKAEDAHKLIELAGTGYKATPDLDSDGGYSL